jgi:glycerol uptake facilitator protein
VTLSLALTDATPWNQVPAYLIGQFGGAILGALLVYLLYKKQFDAEEDHSGTGGIFFTGPSVRAPMWNVLSEFIATYVLILWVLQATPFVPGTSDAPPQFGNSALGYAGVAFAVIGIGASLGGATGYAINPARDFGPRLVYSLLPIKGKGSADWAYAWVPIVGPLAAAVVASGVYTALGRN